jgi:hypothetical protein
MHKSNVVAFRMKEHLVTAADEVIKLKEEVSSLNTQLEAERASSLNLSYSLDELEERYSQLYRDAYMGESYTEYKDDLPF